jgi:hypothetical protein
MGFKRLYNTTKQGRVLANIVAGYETSKRKTIYGRYNEQPHFTGVSFSPSQTITIPNVCIPAFSHGY